MAVNGKDPLDKFIKLMNMTTATHDGEALNAIRMANIYLKDQLKGDWESFVRAKIHVEADPFATIPTPTQRSAPAYTPPAPPPPPRQYDDRGEIQGYFNKLELKPLPTWITKEISAIEKRWQAQGFLLFKDYDYLKSTANSRRKYATNP